MKLNYSFIVFLTILALNAGSAVAQQIPAQEDHVAGIIESDPAKAFQDARSSERPVLLIFAGSDWCMPCIRLEKSILADSGFCKFGRETLIILRADFPQRKKLPAVLQAQYESLAADFDAEGAFPKIVLLTSDRKMIAVIPFTDQSPGELISAINNRLPKQQHQQATALPGNAPARAMVPVAPTSTNP